MKRLIALLGLVMMIACSDSTTTKKTPNGFDYTVIRTGDGILPKSGEVLVFDYIMKDSKDSLWLDTKESGMPMGLPIGDSTSIDQEPGMIQVFRLLSKGDSVSFNISVTKFFTEVSGGFVPPGIDTTRTLNFYVSVTGVMDMAAYQTLQMEMMEKQSVAQLEKDGAEIDAYLKDNGIEAEKTEAGVRYVITQEGEGENATSGQTVSVNYSGYLLDGTYFDSSVKEVAQEKGLYNEAREPYQPYDVTIDQTSVIRGWHDALKVMKKGSKATVYIPSSLAYGPQRRSEEIKENAILVFDLEVVDLK